MTTETRDAESDALVVDTFNEGIFAALANDSDLAKIAAMWANLSPTARQCMMLLAGAGRRSESRRGPT